MSEYAVDPANTPEWYENIESVDWQTPPPARVGSKVAFVARFLGRRLAYSDEIVELVPGRRLAMRTAQGPFPMETTYTWNPDGADGTLMAAKPWGAGRLLARRGAVHVHGHAAGQSEGPDQAPAYSRDPMSGRSTRCGDR